MTKFLSTMLRVFHANGMGGGSNISSCIVQLSEP
jgi:hypothetical protein